MNGNGTQPSIVCRNVVKTYGSGNAEVHALRGVDLDVYPGEITMLVGPSGCGKTTLLSVVAGILRPTSGSVSAIGTDLTKLSGWRRTAFRRKNVGFVFQQFNLLPALTAAENAAVPLVIQGYSKSAAVARANELLTKMGMGDRLRNLPGQLSGGQQQRVAIARALVHGPHLLVCDEPTSALDHKTGHAILELLRTIAIEGDRAVMIVTHDSRIFEFADTLARMDDGRILSIERAQREDRALIALTN
ncbi:MAG TPA: ABC transporter ATP-binding protein [Lacipirellulaceae bacterium]|nr:ABC transporter ATP-binding protein [Lacipirellulaceae bacterium]